MMASGHQARSKASNPKPSHSTRRRSVASPESSRVDNVQDLVRFISVQPRASRQTCVTDALGLIEMTSVSDRERGSGLPAREIDNRPPSYRDRGEPLEPDAYQNEAFEPDEGESDDETREPTRETPIVDENDDERIGTADNELPVAAERSSPEPQLADECDNFRSGTFAFSFRPSSCSLLRLRANQFEIQLVRRRPGTAPGDLCQVYELVDMIAEMIPDGEPETTITEPDDVDLNVKQFVATIRPATAPDVLNDIRDGPLRRILPQSAPGGGHGTQSRRGRVMRPVGGTAGSPSEREIRVDILDDVLEDTEEDEHRNWGQSHLQAFFSAANFVGVAPYRYTMLNNPKTWCGMIPYIMLSLFAFAHILLLLKKNMHRYVVLSGGTTIGPYIDIFNDVVLAVLIGAINYAMVVRSDYFGKVMTTIDTSMLARTQHTKWRGMIPKCLAITSICAAIIGSMFHIPKSATASAWSMRWMLKHHSRALKAKLFSRNWEEYMDKYLSLDPEDDISQSDYIFGVIGCLMGFAYAVAGQFACDAVIVAALTLKVGVDEFKFDDQNPLMSARSHYQGQVMNIYRNLKKVSKELNDAVAVPLAVLLVFNFAQVAQILDTNVGPNSSVMTKLFNGYNLTKLLMFYSLTIRVAGRMKEFKDWLMIEDNRESARIDSEKARLAILEMAGHPVGLKSGENLINKTVMVSCFVNGIVYFLATVETRQ